MAPKNLGEIGGKSREEGEKERDRLGRREKLAQKVGRREIYPPVLPPPPRKLFIDLSQFRKWPIL